MDRDNSFQTYEKKRYAYLEVGNVGNSRLFREKGVMVLTRIAWAAITISLNKGYSYDLRLRTWHCSSTLEPNIVKYQSDYQILISEIVW